MDEQDLEISAPEETLAPESAPELEEEKKKEMVIHVSPVADIRTREDLDQVMRAHELWLDSVLNPMKKIGAGRANLKGADLSGWDLTGMNFSGATLKHAKLVGAKLYKTNLTAADLSGADLQGADLREAKLRRAILTHADLREANVEGADLRGAHTEFTKFTHKEPPHTDGGSEV